MYINLNEQTYQSVLNQNFAANIKYLNTQAAVNSAQQYQKNIDGKMPVAATNAETFEDILARTRSFLNEIAISLVEQGRMF